MSRFTSLRPAAQATLLLLAGAICLIFTSPKWLVPIAPWLAPAFFLYYVQHVPLRRKWLWFLLATVPANALANLDVMPFPWFIMMFVLLLDGGQQVLLYAFHRWIVRGRAGLGWTLVFPALMTVHEYVATRGDIGTFASVANTQFAFPWLVQLASVTGLWGITLLLYWFAAVAVWAVRARLDGRSLRPTMAFATLFAAVLTFGAIRYNTNVVADAPTLAAGGITVPNLHVLEALYHDKTSKTIHINPEAAPTSAQLQQANQGFVAFVEKPDSLRFRRGMAAIRTQQDRLFALSQRAVAQGAQLVTWSEGSALLLKQDEPALLARGRSFASRNKVYLLMAIGALRPGPIMQADGRTVRPFLENKTVLIDPRGNVVNVFRKNHPVPMAEPSTPGDGRVPVVQTPFGPISPSICYDAEHTSTMRQLGQQRSGLLLLPSGDWRAIAPYHSHMAIFRAVENGCSLARQVSGGLSVFTDYRGKMLASRDDFALGDNITVVRLPVRSVPTLYARFGDWFAFLNVAVLLGFLVAATTKTLRRRKAKREEITKTMAFQ